VGDDDEPGGSGRTRLLWALPLTATVLWAVVVAATGLLGRALDHWASAVTMLFGSFLAGSSPEGGGAVAFPVFTKALGVPAPVARTFGLCIQAVGMTMAAVAVWISGRPVHRRSVLIGSVGGVGGLLVGLSRLGDPDLVFWPPTIDTAWVKATFSIVLATTSVLMVRQLRSVTLLGALAWNPRLDVAVAVGAFAGGVLASLAGTGANIMTFLVLVVLAGLGPKTALPTAVAVMAVVSVVGFVVLGVIDGQLDVTVAGDRVTAVGGQPVDLPASSTDLFGLWLAAVPVVVWGAPLGAWVAAQVRERQLVAFVAVLATVEVVTTFVLVDEIRGDPAMLAYLAGGLVLTPVLCIIVARHRTRLFAPPDRPCP
jgi:uncharacterized membrane protein YfcA